MPETQEEIVQNEMKRAKANDPIALFNMGSNCYREGDYEGAFEYMSKVAELGSLDGHYNLSILYRGGNGVEEDEKRKSIIWKRPPLVVMPKQGSILEIMRGEMEGWTEQ
jgi:TPR repeat protein